MQELRRIRPCYGTLYKVSINHVKFNEDCHDHVSPNLERDSHSLSVFDGILAKRLCFDINCFCFREIRMTLQTSFNDNDVDFVPISLTTTSVGVYILLV